MWRISGNCTIRQITPAGVVTTLAGSAGSFGSADGTGSTARFNAPSGVAVDSTGNVYVADTFNSTIRQITPAGVVTTLAGLAGNSGSADGTGSAARFNNPSGVAVDSTGNIYVADTYNSTIRQITPAGVVTTIGGLAGVEDGLDGLGSAARFSSPSGVAVDSAGDVYVADSGNNRISKGVPNYTYLPPTITAASPLPSGMVGTPYSQTLTASGGTAPYTWSIASGGLPPGLSLSSGGVLSGAPGSATTASFTVQVIGNDGLSSTNAFSLTINPAPTPPTITLAFNRTHLYLSWPASCLGWELETRTNLLSVGVGTNWVPVPGSTTNTQMPIPIDPASPARFYRLRLP